ncbi:unnamed protein product, partial [Vitis vinifera]
MITLLSQKSPVEFDYWGSPNNHFVLVLRGNNLCVTKSTQRILVGLALPHGFIYPFSALILGYVTSMDVHLQMKG